MAFHAEIETAKTIARQAITTTLQNNGFRLVVVHDALDDRLEDGLVGSIVDTVTKREIDSVVLAGADTNIAKFASAWKVLAILMERNRHHSVRSIERLLNAVSVMDINIDVEDSLFKPKELDYAEDDI
jgi:hypothetical protein